MGELRGAVLNIERELKSFQHSLMPYFSNMEKMVNHHEKRIGRLEEKGAWAMLTKGKNEA